MQIFGDGKLMMTPTDQPNNWVNIEQSALSKRKQKTRFAIFGEGECDTGQTTELPFLDSTASVEGGE